jgi:beta-phosphoglucomutase family hydrolase
MKQKRQTHAVLWDMDGVLVNTGEYHYAAWKKTFDELDIPFSEEQFRATFGMNNTGILEIMFGTKLPLEQEEQISERKEGFFREAVKGNAKLLPGVEDALNYFSVWNLKQAIASSAPPKNIEVLVQELQIGGYFEAIVSGYNIPGKPDPAIFLKAARQLGVKPEYCTVIEDAVAGVEAAKSAGMNCIAVTTTNTAVALSKADLILDSLIERNIASLTILLNLPGHAP